MSQREADDLIRDAERFLLVVLGSLGLAQQPSLGYDDSSVAHFAASADASELG